VTARTREPGWVVRRVLENAGLLIFASLLVMSVGLGRYTGALVWCGALLVFFAHAWEARVSRRLEELPVGAASAAPRPRHFNALRWVGIALALGGAGLTL
jgi:hypothetical protein